jgi:hypothetical protein
LKPNIASNEDGCWWKACTDDKTFLVPPALQNPGTDTCVPVRQAVAQTIKQNPTSFDCASIQRDVVYAPNGVRQLPVRCAFNDALFAQETWSSQFGWILILIIFIIFILVVGVLIAGAYKYTETKDYRISRRG